MPAQKQQGGPSSEWRARAARFLLLLVALLAVVPAAAAQTFTLLHSFGGGQDGNAPFAGLTIDRGGNLYGTTSYGGNPGAGTVFKWSTRNSTYSILYNFDQTHGQFPDAQLVFGPDGALYGTTADGGTHGGFGTVFKLQPQSHPCPTVSCSWVVTVLHSFSEYDGFFPTNIALDSSGNLYGVALYGTVYKLAPGNGSWVFSQLADDGDDPIGIAVDASGNVFGFGQGGAGIAFEISNASGRLQVIYNFGGITGQPPITNPLLDSAGNLYGQNLGGGLNDGGTVFELSPSVGGWSAKVLANFVSAYQDVSLGSPNLSMDAQGNIYGTVPEGGSAGYGEVFKLSPSGGDWTYTDLHDFCQSGYPNCSDGCYPFSNAVMDANGNLYGTTSQCGAFYRGGATGGTLWKITP